jgi:hypothetical protein
MLTPELQQNLVQALRAFNHLDTAARLVGVHPNTVRRWLVEGEADDTTAEKREFCEAISHARAEAEVRIVAGVAKAALGGTLTKRVTRTLRDGSKETEETYTAPDGRVGLEFLSRAFPARWARRNALEVTGADGGPIQVDSQSTISTLAERLQAALSGAVTPDGDVIDGEVVDGEVVEDDDGDE